MVDWKKDIKLSDLLARGKDDVEEGDETRPFHQQPFAPQADELPLHQGEAEQEDVSDDSEEVESIEPETAETPFWKRELGFGRRKTDRDPEPDFEVFEDAPAPERSPFFTRTLGFGRAEGDTPSDTDPGSPADELEETTPFWKRELTFGRRKDDATPDVIDERGAEQPESSPPTDGDFEEDVVEKAPFWKRELGFGRRKDDATPDALERGEFDQSEPEPPADEDFEEDVVEKTPFWKRELRFGRDKEDETHESFAEAEDRAEPATGEVVEEDVVEKTPFWKRELRFGRDKEDETHDSWAEAEDRPEPATGEVVEDDVVEKTPFWKRELRFGRGEDDATPDDFEPSEPETPAGDDFVADAVERTPFWKRDLGFGRGKDAAEVDPGVETPETEQATPFWKRELGFGRRTDDSTGETPVEQELPAYEEPEPAEGGLPEPAEPTDESTAEPSVEHEEPAHEDPEPVIAAAPGADSVHETLSIDELGEDHHRDDATPERPVEHEEFEPMAASFAEPESAEEPPLVGESRIDSARADDRDEALDEPDDAPFWKREIKFGRRRDDGRLAPPDGFPEPLGEEPDTATPRRARFWTPDRKFGRTTDEPTSPPDSDVPREQEGRSFFQLRRTKDHDLDAPTSERRPFFKRELSFRRAKDTGHHPSSGRAARGGRTKQVVGLKVGASQIAAAHVVNNGSPEVVQLARQSIEQGIVVGGELRDPDALAEALRDFFTTHKLPNRNVRLGIGNNRIGVRSFEISGVHDPKQLENAIRFRAQEALPIPLDEAVLDYQVIEEAASPTGIRTYRVLLVVAYRELVDRFVTACRGAGLRLVGVDLEAFALLRALSPPPAEGLPEDTALVAVSIGHDRSTFAVSNGTVCEFTRVLDWGGSSFNTAIARALDITPSQAEAVKRTLSLIERDGDTPQSDEHTMRAAEAVRVELQTFARELVSSLHFYQNQPGSLAIGSIALTGGTAHLPGLAGELQRLIGVKVRVGDPLRRVKTGKRVETPAQVGSMAVAIGLGIED